ncbi:MAG: TlpA family protein disulfide reductase [Spirochaetaceae bacterium]|nr:TlpA family protein disulfide reductase [Spirochaetaceae bacterium]
MKQVILWCVLAAGAVSSAGAQSPAVPQEIRAAFAKAGLSTLSKPVPLLDFSLPLLDGSGAKTTLSGFKGKVVFLNFWATWCPPCREEMPSMEALYQRFKGSGLEMLAVDIQEDSKQVGAFTRQFKLTFPVALDTSYSVSARYGIRGIPATFIIDRGGFVILTAVGGVDWSSPAMIAAFEALLTYGQ